jgi:outer membrane autotransporter protein
MRDNPSANFDIVKNIDDILVKIVNNQIISRQNKKSANNVWLNGLYHTSENDGDLDYEADSFGFVGGADRQLSENVIGGLGYSYIKTDGKSSNKDLDIDTHSLFVYGEYSKNNWFVNLYASYNQSEINQDKKVLNYQLNGKYDVDMYSAQVLGGKNIHLSNKLYLRPNAGLRYYHITQNSYKDNAGIKYEEVSGNILTGIVGTDLVYNSDIKNHSVTHRGYLNATYDIVNDDINMYMNLPNKNGYYINQNADNELGFEIGYGLEAQLNENVKIGLNYEFDWQKDYNAHLAFINMQYNF